MAAGDAAVEFPGGKLVVSRTAAGWSDVVTVVDDEGKETRVPGWAMRASLKLTEGAVWQNP